MESLFLTVLNMSFTAGWLVLAVLVLRLIFKKAPKALMVAMWALVALRLLCPFTVESAVSLIPSNEPVSQEFLVSSTPKIQTGISVINQAVNPVLEETLAPRSQEQYINTPAHRLAEMAAVVWLTGTVLMLLYAAFSYLNIRHKVREAMPLEGRLWLCDHISSPFILGIFQPRIYLPSAVTEPDLTYVTEHENVHLKRKDHWWKPLGFLLLSIHWFNPLLWLGYILLCRDIELACDEAVLRKLGLESKKPYSEALLNCSIPRRTLAACPLAFGEVAVKTRIKSVLSYKKPTLWLMLAAVLTCSVLAVCLLTDPKTETSAWAEACLNHAVLMENRSEDYHGIARVAEIEILGTKKWGRNRTTYYLWVYYAEYTQEDGLLYEEKSCMVPTVITLGDDATVHQYWTPGDGADYADDIRKTFPYRLWDEALDPQRYVQKLQLSCEKQAWQRLSPLNREQTQEELQQELANYPYFGLDTTEGLRVYVWQTKEDTYRWALMPGGNRTYTLSELEKLPGVTLRQMQYIVSTYDLPAEQISIHPVVMPRSGYPYVVDDAYREKVRRMFWTAVPVAPEEVRISVNTMTFDLDGDGKEEVCTITPDQGSAMFRFRLTATEDGVEEYTSVFTGMYREVSFEKITETKIQLRCLSQGDIPELHYFDVGVDEAGNITLQRTTHYARYWGSQNTKNETEQGLALAIAARLKSRYVPQTEGNICTVSYGILARHCGTGLADADNKNSVTVCLAVLQAEYSLWADVPEYVSSRYVPAYMTFSVDANGNYSITEYCDDYHRVMEKFPDYAAKEVSDVGKYGALLRENCEALAKELHAMQQGNADEQRNRQYDLAMEIRISSH